MAVNFSAALFVVTGGSACGDTPGTQMLMGSSKIDRFTGLRAPQRRQRWLAAAAAWASAL